MSIFTSGLAVHTRKGSFSRLDFERRSVGAHDVHLRILYCGICHSDISVVDGKWGSEARYPLIPGHEIVGKVVSAGAKVTKFQPGDIGAVGCYLKTCTTCKECQSGSDAYCAKAIRTYDTPIDGPEKTTKGGYSHDIVVDVDHVFTVPLKLQDRLPRVAPLLCAGITCYTPLVQYNLTSSQLRAGVIGLGGLGHVAVKFAKALGQHVTVVSSSPSKKPDALNELKADRFICSTDAADMSQAECSVDYLIDTVSAPKDLSPYVRLLDTKGILVLVGLPEAQFKLQLSPVELVRKNRMVVGSLVGNKRNHQEMLDFCGQHDIVADIELIHPNAVQTAVTSWTLKRCLRVSGRGRRRSLVGLVRHRCIVLCFDYFFASTGLDRRVGQLGFRKHANVQNVVAPVSMCTVYSKSWPTDLSKISPRVPFRDPPIHSSASSIWRFM